MKYAGIGSRETPPAICTLFSKLALQLSKKGFQCVTGGAKGADSAFMKGDSNAEVWLPFDGYNGYHSALPLPTANERAFASQFHPNWKACDITAQNMHARNCNIVLGDDIDCPKPVEFILCWTPNAELSGGTAQALRIAEKFKIPVFNFGKDCTEVLKSFKLFLKSS